MVENDHFLSGMAYFWVPSMENLNQKTPLPKSFRSHHLNRESRNRASQGRPKRHSDAISWIFSAPNRVGLATNWNLIREFAINFFTRKCLDFTKDLHISYETESPLTCECTGEILNDLNDLEPLEK